MGGISMSNKCPCINCVCVPVCRNKLYTYLFKDCALVRKYVINYSVVRKRHIENMKEIVKVLKPIHWIYEYKGSLDNSQDTDKPDKPRIMACR